MSYIIDETCKVCGKPTIIYSFDGTDLSGITMCHTVEDKCRHYLAENAGVGECL